MTTGARCQCGLVTWEDECVPDCPRSGHGMVADFELTVFANLDPEHGMVAVGNDGVTVAGPSDFVHVRRWVLGMVQQMGGQLPAGWDVVVTVHGPVDEAPPAGRPDRPPLVAVPPPVDRHAAVTQAVCGSPGCGMLLRRDSPDGVWYHVPACTDPDPLPATDRPLDGPQSLPTGTPGTGTP